MSEYVGRQPVVACPRCGIRRQLGARNVSSLCADCRYVEPDWPESVEKSFGSALQGVGEFEEQKECPEPALTGPGLPHSRQHRKEAEAIMATPDSTLTAPPRVDACPSCCVNVEPPRSTVPTDDGVRCGYVCTDCGHAWLTSWKVA